MNILQEYKDYLSTQGRAGNTIKNYTLDIELLFRYLNIEITIDNVNLITYNDLQNFIEDNKKDGKSNSTNARRIATIKNFFKYLKKTNIVMENPAYELEQPKIAERLPIYLNIKQCKRAFAKVERKNNRYKIRDMAILKLFINTGLRAMELVNINISDIKGDMLKIIGKGNKERIIYLNSECKKALEEYIDIRGKHNTDALFLSRSKQRIAYGDIYLIVKKYTKVSPHKLRHTFGTIQATEANTPIAVLKEMMGHGSISTTEIYIHSNNDSQRKAANSINI